MDVPHVWGPNSETKAQIKNPKTCGPSKWPPPTKGMPYSWVRNVSIEKPRDNGKTGYRNMILEIISIINNRNVTRRLASGASEVMSKVSHWRSRPWEAVLYRRLHFLDPWLGPRGPQRSLRALNFYTLKPLQYGCLRTPLDPTRSPVPVPRHCGTFSVLNGTFCTYFLYLFLALFTSCPTYENAEILIFFLKFNFSWVLNF